jgi:flagellar FliL protein
MATNQLERATAVESTEQESTDASPAPGPVASGGLKPWLPLIANFLLMPVLAYAMTTFVLLPKMKSRGHAASGGSESGENSTGSSGIPVGKESKTVNVPLGSKVLVNVSGTMGTRYLLANITLVGGRPELKESVEKKDAQLRDVAASVLANKTIADIDKPGARNLIRTELVSAFNNVLGKGAVSEIFFTEFAIQ